jgi:hypothetical protein
MVANGTVGAELCRWAVRRVVWDAVAQILGKTDCHLRGNPFSQDGLRCDTWAHAVEMPIRRTLRELQGPSINGNRGNDTKSCAVRPGAGYVPLAPPISGALSEINPA